MIRLILAMLIINMGNPSSRCSSSLSRIRQGAAIKVSSLLIQEFNHPISGGIKIIIHYDKTSSSNYSYDK